MNTEVLYEITILKAFEKFQDSIQNEVKLS